MKNVIAKMAFLAFSSALSLSAAWANDCLDQHEQDNPDYIYTDNADATVTDEETGLMWSVCPVGFDLVGGTCDAGANTDADTYLWSEAFTAKDKANIDGFAGHADWRVPTVKELATLIAPACANSAFNQSFFPEVTSASYLWSSSPNVRSGHQAWAVTRNTGDLLTRNKNSTYLVYLVRNN